jgi:hypothetical protein
MGAQKSCYTTVVRKATGSTLKTAFASVHELSVHVHEWCAGVVHVHVWFVPENSCCSVGHVNSYF